MKQLTTLLILLTSAVFALTMQDIEENTVLATWKRNTDDAIGYLVYYGTRSLSAKVVADVDSMSLYQHMIDVGNDTSLVISWPDSVQIYAMVKAYDASGNIGPPSYEAALAPPVFYDRYPQDEFLSPYDGYKINQYYGFTRNYYLYDSAYDWNRDGIIDPADKYYFRKHYYGKATK